uniref:Uncharacterized protein n=1 Tax=Oryza sativa subsp. japonica TaxID=39947 RepID=Q2QTU4_ORYSJ|nr:hypothetical protein LOC_Os12g18490 [Oryza sativa Japonica Group]
MAMLTTGRRRCTGTSIVTREWAQPPPLLLAPQSVPAVTQALSAAGTCQQGAITLTQQSQGSSSTGCRRMYDCEDKGVGDSDLRHLISQVYY